ncbi:MAG: Gfo/Idh/MocA family oxidoreductase [Acidimicrobiaceae bacterium]|nr:Gfo/Idh/MocA family oxidoreductase [Acidimicrobiaceae bacterium]MYH76809.1 Gfo/Idh/MocA family oxidoreductase [Acidimicrobiaceae bacterium]MYK77147.1 Gfo/Idh/MocA family oxidoreductase [Acidimicrobiaceae bacterium]
MSGPTAAGTGPSVKVRLGIVGLGSVFEPYAALIRDLKYSGRVEVVAACDIVAGRARRVRDFLHQDTAFSTDYADVTERDDVDAVLVLTAMPSHGEIAAAALAAGKHVLVEKPMSIHLDEAAELVAQARTSPGLLVCAPHVVLSPTYQALWKRVVDDDEIGTVLTARARYGWSGPTWGRWYYDTGGGPLFDLGVYNITSLTGLMGPVKRVTALAGTAIPQREVDGEVIEVSDFDNYQVLLDFGDARSAVVTTGFTMHEYRSPAIELYGTTGVAQMLGDDWAPQGYEIVRADTAGWTTYAEVDPAWPWTAGLRHLVDCVIDSERLLIRPEHAYHCLEVMVKARLAAVSGETQAVSSTVDPVPYDPEAIYVQRGGKVGHDYRIRRHRDD